MTSRVPRVFLASSREALPSAQALKELLEPHLDVHLWNEGFFGAGQYALETLETKGRSFDAAIVLGTVDDRVISRNAENGALRDNLILEFGFFVALFGRQRALLALEQTGDVKTPSDLLGLTCLSFTKTPTPSDGLASAATQIRDLVGQMSAETVSIPTAASLKAVLLTFMIDLQLALNSPRFGFHVWVVDQRMEPPHLVRVARTRTVPKAQDDHTYAEGEGIVGECWRTRASVYADFRQEPYKSSARDVWDQYGQNTKMGMTFEMLEQARGRHLAVGAAPIISSLESGSEFLGCLSFNVNPTTGAALDINPDRAITEGLLDRVSEICRVVLEPALLRR